MMMITTMRCLRRDASGQTETLRSSRTTIAPTLEDDWPGREPGTELSIQHPLYNGGRKWDVLWYFNFFVFLPVWPLASPLGVSTACLRFIASLSPLAGCAFIRSIALNTLGNRKVLE